MRSESLAVTFLGMLACLVITTTWIFYLSLNLFIVFGLPVTWSTTIYLLYLAWYFYDRETPFRRGRPISWVRNLFLWRYLASYFPAKLHKTADLDPSKNYIFAFHPHGYFVFGGFINFVTNATGFDKLFPGINVFLLSLDGLFTIPFFRENMLSYGVCSVSSRSFDYKLKLGPGNSVCIVPGGSAEVSLFDPNSYQLKLKSRKGFIRKALETGACVVPVFSFNEQRLYYMKLPEKWSLFYCIQQIVKMICNVEVPIPHGGWSWWTWFFLPKRLPLNTVVGAPIDFTELKSFSRGAQPSKELIEECHQIYMDALRKLYDENKGRFGDENTPLIFV